VVLWFGLAHTRWRIVIRSVGESPAASDREEVKEGCSAICSPWYGRSRKRHDPFHFIGAQHIPCLFESTVFGARSDAFGIERDYPLWHKLVGNNIMGGSVFSLAAKHEKIKFVRK